MPTIRDVAERAGVSTATVSYVLNNSRPVSEATRQRVLQAAAELGYRPNVLAQSLQARASRILGYAPPPTPPDMVNPVLDEFLHSMADAAGRHGYHVLVFATSEGEPEHLAYQELIQRNRVDGFVLSNTVADDPRIAYLMEVDFPFVAFGRANEAWDFPYVDVDGKAGIQMAVEHLLSLGHRRIGLIAWPEDSLAGRYREAGYRAALEAAGLPLDPALIVRVPHSEASGRQAMNRLLDLPPEQRPTAVVALSDLMAIGAMNAALERGLQVGRDVAIVGFDDLPLARYLRPPLTTLRQPLHQVGELVIDMLLRLIRGEELPQRHVLLPPELVVRESSGRPLHENHG